MAQETANAPKQASGSVSTSQGERRTSSYGNRSQQRSGPPSRSGGRGPQQNRGGFRRRRFQPRRKVCLYCTNKEKTINWKKTDDLRRFINDSGGIFPRRKTGLCAKHQRGVAVAVKRARHIALLPYTSEHRRLMGYNQR